MSPHVHHQDESFLPNQGIKGGRIADDGGPPRYDHGQGARSEIQKPQPYGTDPEVQVCILDHRQEFKRFNLVKPSHDEMVEIHKILRKKRLTTVICQAEYGQIGPEL